MTRVVQKNRKTEGPTDNRPKPKFSVGNRTENLPLGSVFGSRFWFQFETESTEHALFFYNLFIQIMLSDLASKERPHGRKKEMPKS